MPYDAVPTQAVRSAPPAIDPRLLSLLIRQLRQNSAGEFSRFLQLLGAGRNGPQHGVELPEVTSLADWIGIGR